MRAAWFICLFLALAFVLDVHEAAPEPKRRGGGSRRGSSSSSSSSGSGGWFSSGNKNSNSGYPKQNYGEYISQRANSKKSRPKKLVKSNIN